MRALTIVIVLFILLESSNVLTLYFRPGSRRANGVGVFAAWEKSKADPEIHQFVRYLVYWVAGAKLIFIFLLIVILLTTGRTTQQLTAVALILATASFFWRLYPIVRSLDRTGQMQVSGYARTLAIMIAGLLGIFALALIWSLVGS